VKKLPIDVSNIKKMLTGDYVYVDKTKYIYDLITKGRLYFLSRPRRFGKSLLISTLKEIFSGNKELFNDLWIGKSDYDWHKYQAIHLDFSSVSYQNSDTLRAGLIWTLENIAKDHAISISDAPSLETKLRSLVMQLSTQAEVVLLIDEYDYPVLRHLHSLEMARKIQEVLSGFFTVAKSLDAYVRAIFIIGVTKFSTNSIFSGMNNLNDISLAPAGALLLGYTDEEIDTNFKQHLDAFAHHTKKGVAGIKKEMKSWYNGYTFSEKTKTKVYNPFSILYCLQRQEIRNYWFESGTPSFLIELLKKRYQVRSYFENLNNIVVSRSSLGAFDITTEEQLPLYTLLFQTGYLTIKSFDENLDAYTLTCPNEEVCQSINGYLLSIVSHTSKEDEKTT